MDFKPVLRMMVCSDIHFGESDQYPERYKGGIPTEKESFENAVQYAYAFADNSDYKKLDALVCVGDFVTTGIKKEFEDFKKSVDKVKKPETELLLTMASHEYFGKGVESANEYLYDVLSAEPMRHIEINGFHLIGASTDERCQTKAEKQEWIKKELAIANEADPKKPIFFFFHPQFQNTVYGSAVLWRTPAIYQTVMNYPQVVAFSGHSHAPLCDPRTVHQKYFTSFGTGALVGLSCCDPERVGLGRKAYGTAHFLIVEADKDGRVLVYAIDGTNGKVVYKPFLVEKPYDIDSFVYTDKRYQSAKAPSFPQDPELCAQYKDGVFEVSFLQATDNEDRVPGYRIIIRDSQRLVKAQFGVCSDYYMYENSQRFSFKKEIFLAKGEYAVECIAQSFYDKESEPVFCKFYID